MKSFTEYLTESKRVYEFKIKIAGDCPKDCVPKIKEALSTYKVESCSKGKGVPITEKQADFPQLENVGVTIFDVCLSYPANTVQVREAVANKLNVAQAKIRVRNIHEEEELAINHEHDVKSGESLLLKDYEDSSEGQKLVGEKHAMGMLKELNKVGHQGLTQYKGVNDEILAKSVPAEKANKKGK
jgi:hypothetical protein